MAGRSGDISRLRRQSRPGPPLESCCKNSALVRSPPQVRARVAASTKEFYGHQINPRPAFVLEDAIGDKAVFSGIVRIEPLVATLDAMLADTAAYAAHRAHHGTVPKA